MGSNRTHCGGESVSRTWFSEAECQPPPLSFMVALTVSQIVSQ